MATVFIPQRWPGNPGRVATLVAPLGAPGCGKSTAILRWMRHDPATRTRVGRDYLRDMMDCMPVGSAAQEGMVTLVQGPGIRALLGAGVDVAVDDTNVQAGRLGHWAHLADELGMGFEVWDFTGTPLLACRHRNAQRRRAGGRYVDPVVIETMHAMGLAARQVVDPSWVVVDMARVSAS